MRHSMLKTAAVILAMQCAVDLSGLSAFAARRGPEPARTTGAAAPARAVEPAVRKYHVTASDGGILPGHIRVRRGEKVRITFVSRDDKYAIRFKDFGVKETLTPERPVVIEIAPGRAGTYEFSCARAFGFKRFGKNGTLIVTD